MILELAIDCASKPWSLAMGSAPKYSSPVITLESYHELHFCPLSLAMGCTPGFMSLAMILKPCHRLRARTPEPC